MTLRIESWASTVTAPRRDGSLDRLRGLAMVCMLVDHVCIVAAGPYALRMTVGRLAMPLFFIVAGHLVRRLSYRHAGIAVLGAFLPVVVPWIDSPNVLLVYALGAVVVAAFRHWSVPLWPLVAVALAFSANGFRIAGPHSYDVLALLGLMALGAMLPRSSLRPLGAHLPECLSVLGRHPLSFYVGHLLLLQLALVVAS